MFEMGNMGNPNDEEEEKKPDVKRTAKLGSQ
jgi:hypothetical protein